MFEYYVKFFGVINI